MEVLTAEGAPLRASRSAARVWCDNRLLSNTYGSHSYWGTDSTPHRSVDEQWQWELRGVWMHRCCLTKTHLCRELILVFPNIKLFQILSAATIRFTFFFLEQVKIILFLFICIFSITCITRTLQTRQFLLVPNGGTKTLLSEIYIQVMILCFGKQFQGEILSHFWVSIVQMATVFKVGEMQLQTITEPLLSLIY